MKLPILLTLCLLAGVVNPARPQARRTRTQAEQTRSADRERAKREQAVADSLAHLKALRSLDRLDFALEADRLTLRRGRVVFVSSDTNFVTLSGDMATVQVAPFMGGGPNGIGGITEATNMVTSYFDPGTKLIYAIGAVVGLIGGVKVYSKFSSGDPDTSKTAASWFGACIFLIVAATILRSFFL